MTCDKDGLKKVSSQEKNLDFLKILAILNLSIIIEIYEVLEGKPQYFNQSNRRAWDDRTVIAGSLIRSSG